MTADSRQNPTNAAVWSRNLAAHACPRCGARTRASLPCKGPAMPNGRCRMHGGTKHKAPERRRGWSVSARPARCMAPTVQRCGSCAG